MSMTKCDRASNALQFVQFWVTIVMHCEVLLSTVNSDVDHANAAFWMFWTFQQQCSALEEAMQGILQLQLLAHENASVKQTCCSC